jgi:hypothetical protein
MDYHEKIFIVSLLLHFDIEQLIGTRSSDNLKSKSKYYD